MTRYCMLVGFLNGKRENQDSASADLRRLTFADLSIVFLGANAATTGPSAGVLFPLPAGLIQVRVVQNTCLLVDPFAAL